jgi:hypothetical protein
MAAAALATAPSGAGQIPRWIIGRGVDLTLVIGSALAGYLYVLLYAGFHVPITLLWWLWSVGFDGTHIFATASRTYFDSEARRRNPALFYGSLVFFFSLGPLMVLAGRKGWLYLLVGVWACFLASARRVRWVARRAISGLKNQIAGGGPGAGSRARCRRFLLYFPRVG